MHFFLHSVLSFCLALSLLVFGSTAVAQPEVVCKPRDIQGRVFDSATGDPIADAKIFVQNNPHSTGVEWQATKPEEDLILGKATSDANGRFRIEWGVTQVSAINNAAVRADIIVMKPNYAIAFRESSLWMAEYLQFKLVPDVEHVGTVLDDQGNPLADAEVRLDAIYRDVEWVNRGSVFSSDREVCSMMTSTLRPRVKTDKDGKYRMRGLASGYIAMLQVTHPKFPSIRRMQAVNENSPKSIRERLDDQDIFGPWYNSYRKPMKMLPGKLGKIIVIEEGTQKPIANIEVCRFFSGDSTKSDHDGNLTYWLPESETNPRDRGIAHGIAQYYARRVGDQFWSMAYLTLGDGGSPAKLMVPLRRTVTGYVRDQVTGKGIEGVAIHCMNHEEKAWTFTDRDGQYMLPVYNRLATIVLNGPKMGYDLPVSPQSNQREEPSRKVDDKLHLRSLKFDPDQLSVEANFLVPSYPKLKVRVVDASGKPVQGTEVKLHSKFAWSVRPSKATSDADGIAAFDIDRPVALTTAWVANANGFGVASITSTPSDFVTLTVEPTVEIPGILTAKNSEGNLRNAKDIPILLNYKDMESGQVKYLEIGVSGTNGEFTLFLPPSNDQIAELSVDRIDRSSIYEWTTQLSDQARADFVMDDDRLP